MKVLNNISDYYHKCFATTLSICFLIGGVLGQSANAETYPALSSGEEAWTKKYFERGEYVILVNSPNSLGDVDIELYDSNYKLITRNRNFGTDRVDLTVHRAGIIHVKYRMATCINPFGCAVSIDYLPK